MRGKRFRSEAETFDDDEFDDDEFDDSDELYDPDDDFDEADDEYDEDTDDEFDDDFEAEFDEDTDDEYDDDEGGDDEYDDYDDEDGRVQDDDDEDEYYDEDDADREPLLARIRRTGSKVRSNVHVSATTATRIGVAIALLIVGAFVYSVLAAGRRATIVVDNEPTQQAPTSSTAQGAAVDSPPTSAVPLVPIALPPPDTTTAAPTTAAPTTAVPATAAPPASDALGSAMPTFPAPDGPVTYSTLPDGSPAPVVAIFDVDTITLAGNVPSQAAKDKLQNLALANSKTPAAVQNLLVIDPSVPIGIGVRVIELTSTRFPEGSSEILPDHAKEFDRIVAVMNALPSTTALVIGHADQLGTDEGNQRISEARASAVVTYLIRAGIAPSRLASRAVGATDLLTLANDDASLALNRRTEFVIYGLLLSS